MSDECKPIILSLSEFREEISKGDQNQGDVFYRGLKKGQDLLTTLARKFPGITEYNSELYYKKAISYANKDIPQLHEFMKNVPEDFIFRHNFLYPSDEEGRGTYKKQAHAIMLLMMHARHYGYESPLLDWSKDPNVALYFAFAGKNMLDGIINVLTKVDNSFIKAFCPTSSRLVLIDPQPQVNEYFKNFSEHEVLLRRHYAQKSAYTICYGNGPDLARISYHMMQHDEYEALCLGDSSRNMQYKLARYSIPFSEYANIEKYLRELNVTKETLFPDKFDLS